jgi:hypothetical protein
MEPLVPAVLQRRKNRDTPVDTSLPSDGSIGFLSRLPSPGRVGALIGAGRTAIGVAFLAAPVTSVRVLGLETATSERVTWLAQMAAIRDTVIGAGTLASARRPSGAGWLMAGAVADLTDAVVIGSAVRRGRLGGLAAQGIVVGAAGAAVAGLWAAVAGRRRAVTRRD